MHDMNKVTTKLYIIFYNIIYNIKLDSHTFLYLIFSYVNHLCYNIIIYYI